jgi:SAM-dependent methyltransferase
MNGKNISWEEAVTLLKSEPQYQDLVKACFFDDPLQGAADRYHQSTEWQALKTYLPKLGKVLDIGSGRGISAYAFAKEGWQVNALEPDGSEIVGAGAIKLLAEDNGLNIEIEQTWGEKLPFKDASFDLVHGRQVLHHARDLNLLCKEAARVLKPNGVFIFTREHVISKPEDLRTFLDSHPLHELYGGEHAYMLEEYKVALGSSGLVLKDVLNPMQSDINLYPDTILTYKKRIAKKFMLPSFFVMNFFLKIYGDRLDSPGRLYSFVGHKNA